MSEENIDWDKKDQVLEAVKEDSNNFKKASERLRGDFDVIKVAYRNYKGDEMEIINLFAEHSTGFIHEFLWEGIVHGWICGVEGTELVPKWNE